MSFTKTNLEILKYNMIKSIQADSIKSRTQLPKKSSLNNNDNKKEFTHKVNIVDAKTLLEFSLMKTKIAPKFKHIYANDEYNFGVVEHFINNCNMKNLNNITTINNDWYDSWNDLHQIDIVVSSQTEEIEDMKSALYKLYGSEKKRIYIHISMNSDFKEEGILDQLKRHIAPKIDNIHIVSILKSMGICAKIDFIHRENKRFLAQTSDIFLEKIQMSLKEQSESEKIDLKKYFDKTYNFKRDTSFIKWGIISWTREK